MKKNLIFTFLIFFLFIFDSVAKDIFLSLKNDTVNIVEYVEKTINKNKKNYNFWKLINNNE